MKIIVFDISTAFFDSFKMFFSILAEIRLRTIMKLPQKASLGTNKRSFGTSITLSYQSPIEKLDSNLLTE